jgi:hypothetical protein
MTVADGSIGGRVWLDVVRSSDSRCNGQVVPVSLYDLVMNSGLDWRVGHVQRCSLESIFMESTFMN